MYLLRYEVKFIVLPHQNVKYISGNKIIIKYPHGSFVMIPAEYK